MLKDIKLTVDIDETSIKLLLENDIQRIQDRIAYAKSLKNSLVKMQDGTFKDRLVWIVEAGKELKLLQAELNKLKG
jgi:hypothetical protein